MKANDPKLGTVRISGRIRADRIDDFVEVFEINFGVVAERTGHGEVVLRRR